MKNLLLIFGIISIIACVLSLLFAAFNLFGYYNVLDGSADLYNALRQRANLFGMIGVVLAVIGIVCLTIRFKL